MVTETDQKTVLRNGLRILAHMIARSYLKDIRVKQSELTNSEKKPMADDNNMEVNDANKRNKRGYKATPSGENKAGDKEGEC